MARRKDHAPEELKALIHQAAKKIIYTKGLQYLTARHLAKAIGYTPGTIYNFYRAMDALVAEVNYDTLGRLEQACRAAMENRPQHGLARVKALAYAYVDFSRENIHAWETLFSGARMDTKSNRMPKPYQQKVSALFRLIEDTLCDCLRLPQTEAQRDARLLWASLHGITVLTLDGRLKWAGVDKSHPIIDRLLEKYFASCAN